MTRFNHHPQSFEVTFTDRLIIPFDTADLAMNEKKANKITLSKKRVCVYKYFQAVLNILK